jgi:adenylate kinase
MVPCQPNVILIGAPGVGKGTQSERLLHRFPQLASISTGDLLRTNVKRRTPLGIQAEAVMRSGGLVADDLVVRLITSELETRGWLGTRRAMTLNFQLPDLPPPTPLEEAEAAEAAAGHHTVDEAIIPPGGPWPQASDDPSASFILDGYPRTAVQAHTLDSIVPINLAVSLITPFSVILDRIAGRWVHEPSGRVYNTTFNAPRVPGKDDVTGETLVQRADDNIEVFKRRLQKFREASDPLLEHYAKKGVLLEVEGLSSDEISPKLYDEFEKRFVW